MNVININSDIEITHSQKSFIEEVLFFDNDHMIERDSFYWLSKKIPIFLINEDTMKKYEISEQNSDFKPHTEWLGIYLRDSSGLFEQTPTIAICPKRIADCVQNDEEFMFLSAKVIVHEFAHAKMDYGNKNVKYRKKDDFWHWMEESMANQITLEVFRDFTEGYQHNRYKKNSFRNKNWENSLFDFVINFIKRQPPEYALGYEIFDKKIGQWWIWRSHKDELGGKKKIKQKTAWLKYMQQNYKSIDETIAKKLYEKLFNRRQK